MKVKIKEIEKIVKEIEIDIDFPIYKKQWLDDSTLYMKVENIEKQISIHVWDDDSKIELEVERPCFWGDKDYMLGNGIFKSNREEFEKAFEKINKLIFNIK